MISVWGGRWWDAASKCSLNLLAVVSELVVAILYVLYVFNVVYVCLSLLRLVCFIVCKLCIWGLVFCYGCIGSVDKLCVFVLFGSVGGICDDVLFCCFVVVFCLLSLRLSSPVCV